MLKVKSQTVFVFHCHQNHYLCNEEKEDEEDDNNNNDDMVHHCLISSRFKPRNYR